MPLPYGVPLTRGTRLQNPNYSDGSFFSDGVRVGPFLNRTHLEGTQANSQTRTALDQVGEQFVNQGSGILLSSLYSYSIAPYLGSSGDVCSFQYSNSPDPYQIGIFTPDSAVPRNGSTWMTTTSNGIPALQFDFPRSIQIVLNIDSSSDLEIEIWGEDFFGNKMYGKYPQKGRRIQTAGLYIPQINSEDVNNFHILSNRAWYRLYLGRMKGFLNVGGSCVISTFYDFGLPYFYDSQKSSVASVQWQGQSEFGVTALNTPLGFVPNAALIPGDVAEPSKDSGDLRGTYRPSSAPQDDETVSNRLVFTYYVPGADCGYNIQSWNGVAEYSSVNSAGVPLLVQEDLYGKKPFWKEMPV